MSRCRKKRCPRFQGARRVPVGVRSLFIVHVIVRVSSAFVWQDNRAQVHKKSKPRELTNDGVRQ